MRNLIYQWSFVIGFLAMVIVMLGVLRVNACIVQMEAHPSGKAVYLKGSHCLVNSTADISLIEFNEMMVWCSVHHMEYLVEKE